MKFFPKSSRTDRLLRGTILSAGICGVALFGWQARADLPRWMQDAVGASSIEAALYRVMQLPGVSTLYPRPPKEAQAELSSLIAKSAQSADLYFLRAMEEEQALDFNAAEADWKAYVSKASDKLSATLQLATYYQRRLQSADEVHVLMDVGSSPAAASEQYTASPNQRSWAAFERLLQLAADQHLDEQVTAHAYATWIARYPEEQSIYERELRWQLDESKASNRFERAQALIAQYRKAFPHDAVFPLKASAEVEYRHGSVDKALGIYDAGFQPLWPAELVQSYYALLAETHTLRRWVADARARLAHNPDDLNAMARLFYAQQQQGNLVAAQRVVEAYRLSKESRKATWNAQELYTLAQLTEGIHAYPEAARYDYALYHASGPLTSGDSPQAEGLSNMIRIMLTAPDQPVELGSGNLSMYRDIATLDQGPGYWNGVLSLWLNSNSPETAYHEEEQRAQPYFHRAMAAQLLTLLDRKYPKEATRAELHKEMIHTFADYGESALVLSNGKDYLSSFKAPSDETNRVYVAMLMADAYAQKQDTKSEFALYDRILAELGSKTAGMPLTAAHASNQNPAVSRSDAPESTSGPRNTESPEAKSAVKIAAFTVTPVAPAGVSVAGSTEYSQMLERYLGRLTATGQLPQALAVLRKELDRNPNDPLLYERLATFLGQNNLSAQQEDLYTQAIQRFQDKGWYDKLARLYLREKKREAFADLTKKVTGIFSGTELESYFQNVNRGGPQLFLQLNLYAHERFPHDQVFVQNLLQAYQTKATSDPAAWEKLLREHWSDSEQLRAELFDYLTRNGKLNAELARLHELVPGSGAQKANPAATRELAEVAMWQSHFEESAPLLGSLAEAYPAEEAIGTRASSVFRSLAYYDIAQTAHAVEIEKRLLTANPADLDRLARIGDIYADSGSASAPGHENIRAAKPYWRRIPSVHPGTTAGYLQAATIFWDYYQFDDALAEIQAARTRFDQPRLFGYEAGAIEEGKRDMAAAIQEYLSVATGAADGSDSEAAMRLLQLARRKATAKTVDQATAKALETQNTVAALELRERVLKVQKRSEEIGPLLTSALNKAATFEQAQAIGAQAQSNALPKVYELAVQREVALVNDPAQKIELSYELARSFEERKAMDDATRIVLQVYLDNPKVLGVVRNTVDFYSRNRQPAKAIATLLEASKAARAAQPALSRQFVVEAADKSNSSGDYARARSLMVPLVDPASSDDPYNPQYISIVAESYAMPGDDAGLKQFYLSRLDAIHNVSAHMTAEQRRQTAVLLRRGLIPALSRMKDYSGAVDQYIAILSAYPEDPGTTQEAALYALRYKQQKQLVEFLSSTVKASPRDSRFAIMLAEVQTTYDNYPAAIDAYAHAISIRGDRSDVYEAKADLEERLQRLDDACKEYERLYVLSYQDPDWMVKIAAARARQGRKEDAVRALERAWIKGHPATASDYFRVARQLESWQMLDESLQVAELGVKAEGDDLLAGSMPGRPAGDDPEGAFFYAHLMTRLRRQDSALLTLDAARKAADGPNLSPSIVAAQVEKEGIAAVTDSEWRKRRIEERQAMARQRFRGAMLEMGKTASLYFTPEEKQPFAKLVEARWTLDNQTAQSSHSTTKQLWIDVANAAGLNQEEAQLRKLDLLDHTPSVQNARNRAGGEHPQFNLYQQLQRSRMEYSELAQTMDAYAQLIQPQFRQAPRVAEVQAWRSEGDEAHELRALSKLSPVEENNNGLRERHLELLLKRDRPGFESYAATSTDESTALAAPNYATAHSDLDVANAALSAHTWSFGSLWQKAYTALLGLYFRDTSQVTEAAFHSVLADQKTIAERISTRGRDAGALTGRVWFYYGMRYGVYRTLAPEWDWPQHDPEDFLASSLEHSPSAGNFVSLARAYADAGRADAALAEYAHALELAPNSAAVQDAMAVLLWQHNKHEDAIARWRESLATLNRIQDKGPAPESFWTGFVLIAQHLGSRKLTTQLHGDLDSVLRNYIARNGDYRSNELLKAAYSASPAGSDGLAWILSLSTAANDSGQILFDITSAPWMPAPDREMLYLRQIELARIAAAHAERTDDYTLQRLFQLQRSLAVYYVAQKQDAKAEALISTFTEEQQKSSEVLEVRIQLAAHTHTLDALLNHFRVNFDNAAENSPGEKDLQVLRTAAGVLAAQGDHLSALALWECVFELGHARHDLMASDYLGLAEARLLTGNISGSLELLRRVTLLPGDVYDNYNLAAALLENKGYSAQAVEFLSVMAKGVPWNASYSFRLARAQLQSKKAEASTALVAIAGDSRQTYDLRIQAAVALEPAGAQSELGSSELDLLASGNISPQQAQQPYFTAARIDAAASVKDAAQRRVLLRQAIAMSPSGLSAPGFTGEALRLAIFRAEALTGHDATALEALQPLLNKTYAYNQGQTESQDAEGSDGGASDETASAGEEATDFSESEDIATERSRPTLPSLEAVAPLPPSSTQTDADKLALALLVGQVYEQTGSPGSAVPYLKLAAFLQKDPSARAQLESHIRHVETAILLEAQNMQRSPNIRRAIDQSNLVRPRLTIADLSNANRKNKEAGK